VGEKRRTRSRHAGFISTRIAGTDGVSLEIEKWAAVLERNGYRCFYFSGENDRPEDRCRLEPEAHFLHPEILALTRACFGKDTRSAKTTRPGPVSERTRGPQKPRARSTGSRNI